MRKLFVFWIYAIVIFCSCKKTDGQSSIVATQRVVTLDLNNANIYCAGNSLTEGYGSTNPPTTSYPTILQGLLTSYGATVTNIGISGTTTGEMITAAPSTLDNHIQSGKTNICIGWEITNDIGQFGNLGAALNRWTDFYTGRKQVGWDLFITITCIPRAGQTPVWGTASQFSAMVDASVSPMVTKPKAYADYVINIRDYEELATYNTTYWNADMVHLNDAGYAFLAGVIHDYLVNLLDP